MVSGQRATEKQRKQILRMNWERLYTREFTLQEIATATGVSRQTVASEIRDYAARAFDSERKSQRA